MQKQEIKFIILPPEQAEAHVKKLQRNSPYIEIHLTDGISATTEKIHHKAAAITESHPELGPRAKTVIESSVGHVHGRAIGEIQKALEGTLKRRGKNLDTKKAIGDTTTWNLNPEGIRAVIREGIAILAPLEGPVEIPKPEKSKPKPKTKPPRKLQVTLKPKSAPEVPASINSTNELRNIFEQLINFYTKPKHSTEDVVATRKKLKEASTKSPIIKKLINRFLVKTMLLGSKNKALRPTKKSLLEQFVINIAETIKTIVQELKAESAVAKRATLRERQLEKLANADDEEGDEDGIAGLLEKNDLRFFDPNTRKQREKDYEDDKQRKTRPSIYETNPEYQPQPEDFEDRPGKPDDKEE